MQIPDIPIICTLTDAEFRERERSVLSKLMPAVLDTQEIENGFRYRFSPDDAILTKLNEFIILERKCCPFLDFHLTVERGNGGVWLELSGAEGAQEFIAATLINPIENAEETV